MRNKIVVLMVSAMVAATLMMGCGAKTAETASTEASTVASTEVASTEAASTEVASTEAE